MNKKVYERVQKEVLDRITKALETGEKFHWVRPWDNSYMLPKNYFSSSYYRGANLLTLQDGGEYLTFNQIKTLQKDNPKIHLRKGAMSKPIIYFDWIDKKDENGNIVLDDELKPIKIPMARMYSVFHIQEVECVETRAPIHKYEHTEDEITKRCDKVIELFAKKTGLEIQTTRGATSAYYNPHAHVVSLPDKSQFSSLYEYYHTVFHELAHSHLHNRSEKPIEYAKGELEAELTASLVCNALELNFDGSPDNDVAYLNGWSSRIKGDKITLVLNSACRAAKALEAIYNEEELRMSLEAEKREKKRQKLLNGQRDFKITNITFDRERGA